MLRVVIIEDNYEAAQGLKNMLLDVMPEVKIQGVLHSVAHAIEWFHIHKHPDLILMDIRLPDGDSFSIFEHCKIEAPVIFITAYDNFIEDAFENNGIDYIFKPIERNKLVHALKKYEGLRLHFENKYNKLLEYMISPPDYPSRFIIKRGREFQAAKTSDVVCFFSKMKIVFIKTNDGREHITDQGSLGEAAEKLDPKKFFKVNRKFIVNIDYVKRFIILEFSKLLVELTVPMDEAIIVSQFTAPQFKKWIEDYN